ncbi:beta-lactamase-like protein [Phlebopus sp. FC_14]|nr:beta-lactamase-like protein [Phlebopus sp. FC_14]
MSANTSSLKVTLLGAGQEVGRSCCVLRYGGKTIVCDAGVHMGYSGVASLPFIDELDWSTVDAILITHFHLDHAAAITYIMEKTNFRDGKGKVYMTHPTKAIHKLMMQDFLRMRFVASMATLNVTNIKRYESSSPSDNLFTPLELSMSLSSIIPVSFHQVVTPCPGVSFIPYHAGHVLGACMYFIDIAGLKVLYTGDYSRDENHHLVKAEVPPVRPDVIIAESTFGVRDLAGREEQEHRFTSFVHSIINRGGHVLLPVFALGMAQELLLILDKYWAEHPDLHAIPVYYASDLARKCMAVYQTQIHTMNANIQSRFAKRDNPFVFKHISNIARKRGWEQKIAAGPPCVVLASPGFMQAGSSREIFELWAPDPRNGLIITGYTIEGTLARDMLNPPQEVVSLTGKTIPCKLAVEYISFTAHVDCSQNLEFVDLVQAEHVILVHGERNGMTRLRAAMAARYAAQNKDVKIYTPRNLETLDLSFRRERVAKMIGTLATKLPEEGDIISGLLISKNNAYSLVDPVEIEDFAGLTNAVITQRQKIALGVGWELVRWHLVGMFGSVEEGTDRDGVPEIWIMDAVNAKHTAAHELTLEWESSAKNDMIADSTLAVITMVDQSPASVRITAQVCPHKHLHADSCTPGARPRRLARFLEAHFNDVELCIPSERSSGVHALDAELIIHLDGVVAHVNLTSMAVVCPNGTFKRRVEDVLSMAVSTLDSLTKSF